MTLTELENNLGYHFKDKALLKLCLTHKSWSNEHGGRNNERLEYFGDAILQFIVTEQQFFNGGDEGAMTKQRQLVVSLEPLEEAARRLGLDQCLIYGGSENNVGKKTVSSLFECITAGIYLDGGMEAAKKFVLDKLFYFQPSDVNYKGDLQEYLQGKGLPVPTYWEVGKSGTDHEPVYTVLVSAMGKTAKGCGKSKRAAEQSAAKNLLLQLTR